MGIGVRGQGEVTDVAIAVARLLERAQHQVVEDALFGRALDAAHQLLVVARGDVEAGPGEHDVAAQLSAVAPAVHRSKALHGDGAHAEGVAEMRGDLLEIHHPARIGRLVDAVDGRNLRLLEMRRDGLVGCQHELLDDAVRDVARRAGDGGHLALRVELDQGLGQVEIDGAAPHALAIQDQRQLLHQLETARHVAVAFLQPNVALQEQVDVGVRHALHAADHAADEFLIDHVAAMVELEQHREGQAIHMRVKRAQAGRELERQHRNGAVREVDAGPAQTRLDINRRAGLQVVADVGDVDVQEVVAPGRFIDPDGVVEIARGLSVDRHHVHAAEIGAASGLVGADRGRKRLRLFEDFRRKTVRQVVLADHDFDIDAEIVRVSQDLNDAADGVAPLLGKLDDLDVDDHAVEVGDLGGVEGLRAHAVRRRGTRRALEAVGNEDPLLDALVVRDHEIGFGLHAEFAHHGGVGSPQDAHDFGLGAAVAADPAETHQDAIAVHGFGCCLGRDEDVAAQGLDGVVRNHEAVAVAVHLEAAGGEFAAAAGDHVLAGIELDQIAARGQARQRLFEFGACDETARAELPHQLLVARPRVRQARDVVEDFGVAQPGRGAHAPTTPQTARSGGRLPDAHRATLGKPLEAVISGSAGWRASNGCRSLHCRGSRPSR